MTKYITYARNNISPKISDEAEKRLINGYLDMRRMGSSSKVITATPRQLESLIRLSESIAKMRLSSKVLLEDVDKAIDLIKKATYAAAIDPSTGHIDMDMLITGISGHQKQQIPRLLEIVLELMESQEQKFDKGY